MKLGAKQRLIEAATQLFFKQGYSATGLNQILALADAPKGSLYYYFPQGKEELAVASIQCMAGQIEQEIRMNFEQNSNPIEGMQQFVSHLAQRFNQVDYLDSVPIGIMAAETSTSSDAIRQAMKEAYLRWDALYYEQLLLVGWEEAEAKNRAALLNYLIEGGIIRSMALKNGSPLQQVAAYVPTLCKKFM